MTKRRQYHELILVPALILSGISIQARAQSGALAFAAPDAPAGTPVIMNRKQASRMLIARSTPEYPPLARVNYVQGSVQLELTVNGAGKVAGVHVLQGNPVLAESALKAARTWAYRPLETPAGPSWFITTVELRFTLDNWFPRTASEGRPQGDLLTPRKAEQDFMSRVKPAQVAQTGGTVANPKDVVHLRLLVNDQGQVDDMQVSPTGKDQFDAAREALRGWTFHPAHWGTMPVAAYLDVDVPIRMPPISRTSLPPAADDTGRP